ncbi:MAG: hypothetical protein EKK55_13530 [Rhodocyclaceae bacterium]|nr:MAG: hypothetical protein EKK55_13530 [Rhodocyclaceae bacterium]
MNTEVVLRWHRKLGVFLPAREPINPADFEVAEIPDDDTAKRFIVEHHYSATYPAARKRFGFYEHGSLVGVAVLSQPMSDGVLAGLPGAAEEKLELGRFMMLKRVKGNGETRFLGRFFDLLRREGFSAVVSHADPVPRQLADGRFVTPGHVGIIYQGHNGVYQGRTKARTVYMLPNGAIFSDRAQQKIRSMERGWRYAADQLVESGARPLEPGEDSVAWMWAALRQVARRVRHPGNHRYAWLLAPPRRRTAALVPSREPYPRFVEPPARAVPLPCAA